jgi:iron complex transport system permease protein
VRAWRQLLGATLPGMKVMLMADWLGRNLLFPYQIAAGLRASLIGGPYLMMRLARC